MKVTVRTRTRILCAKPILFKHAGAWVCASARTITTGATADRAYASWYDRSRQQRLAAGVVA